MPMPRVPAGIEEGEYFAYGACEPEKGPSRGSSYVPLKFSLGIYRAVARKSRKGLTTEKAVCRVEGYTAQAQVVRDKAKEICDHLNSGTGIWTGPKTVNVKFRYGPKREQE